MKGRPRQPRKTKIIKGTFRSDRNPDAEPEPEVPVTTPAPPAGLNRWARAMWKRLAPILHKIGLLTKGDLETFRLLCKAYGDYCEWEQAIKRPIDPRTGKRVKRTLEQYASGLDPWVDIPSTTDPVELAITLSRLRRNSQTMPELAAMKTAHLAYRTYMAEFGLSPASRNRINVPKPAEGTDPMEKMVGEG